MVPPNSEKGFEPAAVRDVQPPVRVIFPVGAEVPESKRHLAIRTALYQILELEYARQAAIGSDQFVYWDPTNPRMCLAPDVFVRLGAENDDFRSWKVWERGAPHLAVEVISSLDERDRDWGGKLESYRRLGVEELVRFDEEDDECPLRIWHAREGDLVENELEGGGVTASVVLGLFWVVVKDDLGRRGLRLARDAGGRDLLPTPSDATRAAEQRIRELEEELRRKG